jgi:hypothetical protein
MRIEERLGQRFQELYQASQQIQRIQKRLPGGSSFERVENESWAKWSINALNLIQLAFGPASPHFIAFQKICDKWQGAPWDLDSARGVFHAAMEDYKGGYFTAISKMISGELFGDFVQLAKRCLAEGNKDAAAVIACAALEDALKRYASSEGIDVQERSMQDVVNALKSKGFVSGAQKTLLDTMPKIRDYAMHADWAKIRPEDVNSVIGFVEQFLVIHF